MTGHETPLFVFDSTRICCSGGLFSRSKSADGHCPGRASCSAAARNEIAADYVRKAESLKPVTSQLTSSRYWESRRPGGDGPEVVSGWLFSEGFSLFDMGDEKGGLKFRFAGRNRQTTVASVW